jgi:hypothetical protein
VNVGLRVDHYTSFLPQQGNPGEGPWSVKKIFPSVGDENFPKYTQWSPRLSFAYDLTGNGRFALKGSWGRYSTGAGPGATSGNVNPNSPRSCTYLRWDGTIPYRPNFGPDGLMGTADDVNLSGACSGGTGTINFDDNLRASYMDEYAVGADIGFTRDLTLRVNIIRKFDFGGSKTIDVLLPYSAYTDFRQGVDRGRDGVPNTPDDGVVYVWSVPSSNPNRTVVNRRYTHYDMDKNEGSNAYTAYEATFNKNVSNGWSFLAGYTLDLAHVNNAFPQNPNSAYYNWQLPVWSNSFKLSGTYDLPYGIVYAATLTTQSGDWFNRSAQVTNALNSAVTQTVEGQYFRRDRVTLWDNRFAKRFRLAEAQTLEVGGDIYNLLNTNAVTGMSTNSSSSAYKKPTDIIPARIFKIGLKWKF